jgi:hypothetical protein
VLLRQSDHRAGMIGDAGTWQSSCLLHGTGSTLMCHKRNERGQIKSRRTVPFLYLGALTRKYKITVRRLFICPPLDEAGSPRPQSEVVAPMASYKLASPPRTSRQCARWRSLTMPGCYHHPSCLYGFVSSVTHLCQQHQTSLATTTTRRAATGVPWPVCSLRSHPWPMQRGPALCKCRYRYGVPT